MTGAVVRQDVLGLGGAVFSPDELYRYRLWRRWDGGEGTVAFVGLNPSTADAERSDPTVTRCIRRAQRLGFAAMDMLNVFALRSTNPKRLYQVEDPVGPENDRYLVEVCARAAKIVLAWGTHGVYGQRHEQVVKLLSGFQLWCLGVTKDGYPKHPLYLRTDTPLQLF